MSEHRSIGKVADPNYMGDCEACGGAWPCREYLRTRLAEVEAERDDLAVDLGSTILRREEAEARLAEVEQALSTYGQHQWSCHTYDHWAGIYPSSCTCGLAAVLDKGAKPAAPTKVGRHMEHYRSCGCLDDSDVCCDPSCCAVLDEGKK